MEEDIKSTNSVKLGIVPNQKISFKAIRSSGNIVNVTGRLRDVIVAGDTYATLILSDVIQEN